VIIRVINVREMMHRGPCLPAHSPPESGYTYGNPNRRVAGAISSSVRVHVRGHVNKPPTAADRDP
jgi:hypothetical protein